MLLAFFTLACLSSAYLPVFWAVPTELLGQTAAARAVGMINGVGSVAGFVGPYLFGYLNAQTGSFSTGLFLIALSAAAGGVMILYCDPAHGRSHASRYRLTGPARILRSPSAPPASRDRERA